MAIIKLKWKSRWVKQSHHKAQIDLSVKPSNIKTVSFRVHFIFVKISVFQEFVSMWIVEWEEKDEIISCWKFINKINFEKNWAKKVIEKKPLKKTIEKKPVFFHEKNREVGKKKPITQRLKWKNQFF